MNPQTPGTAATRDGGGVGAVRGEAGSAAPPRHGTWGAIKRHRNTRDPLCAPCRELQRTYNRAYARLRQQSPTYAARKAAEKRTWQRDLYTDPARVAQLNAARRRRRQVQQEADRRAVDPIAVERAVDLHQPLPTLNRAEKAAAYTVMIRRGVPRCRVVARLRINWATAREFAGYDTTEATA